jgi:hypothetical protein
MAEGERGSKAFIFVPPGAPKTTAGHHLILDGYPETHFLQAGKCTCLFHGFASALYFLGMVEVAELIAYYAVEHASDGVQGIQNWKALLEIMQSNCGWLQPRKIKGKVFDVLSDISPFPTVVSLESTDGGIQHAVTIVGKLIFDSNCTRALPLCKEALDHCCSSDDKVSRYVRVFHGYRFQEHEKSKQMKLVNIARKDMDEKYQIFWNGGDPNMLVH